MIQQIRQEAWQVTFVSVNPFPPKCNSDHRQNFTKKIVTHVCLKGVKK